MLSAGYYKICSKTVPQMPFALCRGAGDTDFERTGSISTWEKFPLTPRPPVLSGVGFLDMGDFEALRRGITRFLISYHWLYVRFTA